MNSSRITLPIVLIMTLAAASGAAVARDDARIPALEAAEAARFQANVDGDTKALGRLLDDDLEYVHSNGEVNTKSEFIDALTSGRRDYVSTTFEIQKVRMLGNVAILRGTAKVTVIENGQSHDVDIGYTDVWVWKDKRWQMTAWRSARKIPPAAPAK